MKYIITGFLLFVFGCSSVDKSVYLNPQMKNYNIKTVVVLPLENNNTEKYKKYYPEAPDVIRDALESSLIKTGWQIIEREKISKILQELELQVSGLTIENGVKIGKMLNADVIVIGQVTSYVQGAVDDKSPTGELEHTTVGFNVRAVDIDSGVIMWKISVVDSDKNIFTYTNPVQGHAIKVADRAVNELVRSMENKYGSH
jgi:curli biogenesis system outer membrane secretion channel CsgG